MRTLRTLAAAALALAAMAVVSSTATAAPGDVVWSKSKATWSGTLTFKRNGGNAVSCAMTVREVANAPNSFAAPEATAGKCGTQYMTWMPWGEAYFASGSFWLEGEDHYSWFGYHPSPWAGIEWQGGVFKLPFVNAAGTTPSHITFSETVLGKTITGQTVTASGTLDVKLGTENVTLKVE